MLGRRIIVHNKCFSHSEIAVLCLFTVDQIYIKNAIISSIVNDSGNSNKKRFWGSKSRKCKKEYECSIRYPIFKCSH